VNEIVFSWAWYIILLHSFVSQGLTVGKLNEAFSLGQLKKNEDSRKRNQSWWSDGPNPGDIDLGR